ncbi:N-acetyltransferase [Campylobacter sp. faydin G-140]|uniref:GNAT family N-acetyltransferase n=1 Tax=Campylobacter anatolicus TaxID=2829105 RepID=UPI001B919114|nr:GNAT family N-acetyltransferase [Campylobacter anatolicus]MBR8461258.1 N-acetyltransferase [Campylobacter anatolicus]MBR8466450.1 N-acetyltransferase [Campylobacter anatolicus]
MSLEIVLAKREDLPKIVEIYNSTIPAHTSTADLTPVSVEQREPWFYAHKGNRPLYVMRDDGEIVAWCSFSDYIARAAYDISAEISLYVSHNARGKGVGAKFLTTMLSLAPSLGLKNVIAVIFKHNKPSINLFHKFGFEDWGELPDVCDIDGELKSVVILGKRVK